MVGVVAAVACLRTDCDGNKWDISQRQLCTVLAVRAAANPKDGLFTRSLAPVNRTLTQLVYTTLIRREYQGVPKIVVPQKDADLWGI